MKIANIVLTSQNGGVEKVFIDYQKILRDKLNHQVFSIVKDDAPYFCELEKEGIEAVKIKNNFGYCDYFAIKKIQKSLLDFDADAVITHAGRSTVLTKKAIKKIKHKKIIQVAINHSNNVKRSIGADLIISMNKEIFYKTIDCGQNEKQSFVIYNALDLENFKFKKPKINFNKKRIIIGMMARLESTKGFLEMLNAIKILNEKYDKEFILKIAGSGDFEKEIKDEIKKLQIENKVEFLNWINDKEKFFNEIDIFVLPSLNESFGLVILEAMQYFCPIVASDADGPKLILQNEVDGLITKINPKESYPERLAQNILKISENEEFAKNIVKNANKKLQDKFSFARLEKDLENIFGRN